MAENQQPEIPQEMRELALQNIDQARTAYGQLMEAARKAREMIKTMVPSNPVAAGLNKVQERAMRFAQQNFDASFAMANEPAEAKASRMDCKSRAGIRSCRCTPSPFKRRSLVA
jgi:hypothetical protein